MYSNDFVPGVALQSLGTRIPGQNSSLRVEHKDGVVSNAFDEKTKEIGRLGRSAARAVDWNWRGCLMSFRQAIAIDCLSTLKDTGNRTAGNTGIAVAGGIGGRLRRLCKACLKL